MTGAIITQSGQLPFPVVNGPANSEITKGDFKEVFRDLSEGSEEAKGIKTEEKASGVGLHVDKKGKQPVDVKTDEVSQESKVLTDEATQEMQKSLDELKEEIMKTLSVSKEELEDMMEMLGITGAELFTKEGLSALVMGFTGVENAVELLTNEEAYGMITDLTEFVEGILNRMEADFQISEDDLKLIFDQLQEEPMQEETILLKNTDEGTDVDGTQEVTSFTEVTETEHVSDKQNMTQSHSEDNAMTQQNMQGNQFVQNANNAFVSEAVNELSGAQEVSPQEIYDQISEYMRSNVNGDVSEVEMQLNPENLGRLQIRLSAKDGVVSAQFVTQNEVVKGVLETQLIQLKEQFEQQGVKVDAVEVTVAGYSFDQGLNRDTGEHAGTAKEARKTVIRRIHLNEIAEDEELTQDEQIAVEMMTANGNTVDFMA